MILFKFFPTTRPSDHGNPWCVLTDGIIECLKKDPAFSNQYRIALELMFGHWGIAIDDNDQLEVFDAKRFDTYLMQLNHNQSRASRVIQSLREFSQLDGINTEKLAGNFYLLLTEKAKESLDGDQMTDELKEDLKKSMGFWEKALGNPLETIETTNGVEMMMTMVHTNRNVNDKQQRLTFHLVKENQLTLYLIP